MEKKEGGTFIKKSNIINEVDYLITLFLFLSLIFSSCNKNGGKEKNEIRFWHSFVASTYDALEKTIDEFEVEYPNIQINDQYVPTGDALVQKLITAAQSNTLPDIAWIHADFIDKLVKMNAVYDLNSFIENDSSFSEKCLEDIFSGLISAVTYEEKIYGLPMDATTLALLYNKSLFQKVGLPSQKPPEDWEELKYYARQLTRDIDHDGDFDQYGLYVPVFSASGPLNIWMVLQWTPFLWQAGGKLIGDDGKTVLYDNQAGVDALEFWQDLYELQRFENFSLAHNVGFCSQTAAMILDGPWNLPRYRRINDFQWDVAALPAGKAGSITYLSGEYLVAFKQSEFPHEAWTFIKWFLKTDTQTRFAMRSGYLPVRKSVLQNNEFISFMDKNPKYSKFVDQLKSARVRSLSFYNRVEFNQYLAEAIENTIKGKMDPNTALKQAAKKTNKLLEK